MPSNPENTNRRSIRLDGYDYSQSGDYFITICTQDMVELFGQVKEGQMFLNDAGGMIKKWWLKLPYKFPGIQLGTFVIMPNHFHGIIEIMESGNVRPTELIPVGANPSVCPSFHPIAGGHTGPPLQKTSLSQIIQWFKTMTTNEYIRNVKQNNWPKFNGRFWQRNYYEHVISGEEDYNIIVEYIKNNPRNWENDRDYN